MVVIKEQKVQDKGIIANGEELKEVSVSSCIHISLFLWILIMATYAVWLKAIV